ncbi:MAG TPA: TonB family protein [Phenylobacterium sp.]|nr:TonB family protein [Phenylobacterium sp.]
MPIVLAYAEPPAAVAPAPPRPSVITMPDWLRKPTGADMAEFYPKPAAAAHVEGRAVLHCRVAATGDLTDCAASNDEPAGQGFGEAALRLSALFKMRPMTKDGVPVAGGQINIPIRFMLPKQAPLNLETALECYGATAVGKVMLTNGEAADVGWRDAASALAKAEHVPASDLDASLTAAREIADTPGSREGAPPCCSVAAKSATPAPCKRSAPGLRHRRAR